MRKNLLKRHPCGKDFSVKSEENPIVEKQWDFSVDIMKYLWYNKENNNEKENEI